MLDLADLAARLGTRWLGKRLDLLASAVSTNDEAMRRGREGAPHGTVVIADTQTRGRGRLGHTWHSPPGENLYLSVILRPELAPSGVPPITLAAGVGVAAAVNSLGIRASLKWPNDVLVAGVQAGRRLMKVSGILTEMSTRGARVEHVIVGVGVNVNTTAFPPELPDATSLRLALGRGDGAPLDRAGFAASLLGALEHELDRFAAGELAAIVADWRAACAHLGQRLRVRGEGEPLVGIAEDVEDDGALRVRLDGGRTVRVVAGEVEALP